ncbi:MAG: polysaccharide deacetylase family protein [Verrucomicrobiota bacterium]
MFRASLIALLSLPLVSCLAQTAPPASSAATPPAGTTASTGSASGNTASAASKVTFSQCHVDGAYVAMTFDDGPHAENTPRLLDMLKKRNAKATFFVVGECAAQYPAIMKRIVAEGHEIGNHSWSHPLLSKMGEGAVSEQLQRTHDAILGSTGVTTKLMRPPYGGFTANQRLWANKKWGYKTILWDVDPLDWKVRSASHVEGEIVRRTVHGSIVLSHDIHKSTVDAMPATLDALSAKGYKFVTVSELLAMDHPAPPKPKTTPAVKNAPAATPEPAPESATAPNAPAAPAK